MHNKITLAGCVLLNQNNDILLLNRIKTNWYELPGGKIEPDERPAAAAIREIKEELICDVKILRQLGIKDFEENDYTMIYTWYLAEILENQTPHIGEPEKFYHFKYIPISDLSSFKLSPNMQNLYQEIALGNINL